MSGGSTQTTTVGARTEQDQRLMDMLEKLGTQAGGAIDFKALAELASGKGGGITAEDRALAESSAGASAEIARRELAKQVQDATRSSEADMLNRGVEGSTMEAVNRAIIGRGANDQFANIMSQEQINLSNLLSQLPFQRANVQLGANRNLLDILSGTGGSALNAGLQERLNSTTTKTTGGNSLLGIGQMLGGSVLPGIGDLLSALKKPAGTVPQTTRV